MDKQRDDDGIWMFPDKMQGDIESGIDGAISETGKSKGWYSNKINQNFDKLSRARSRTFFDQIKLVVDPNASL